MHFYKINYNYNHVILILLVLGLNLPKWLLGFFIFDFSENINLLANFDDIQYFPYIFNLSNLKLSQDYIGYFDQTRNFAVPLVPFALHALFYKFSGLIGLIFLELFLQLILIIILFKIIKKIFQSNSIAFIFCFSVFGSISIIRYLDSYYLNFFIGQVESIFGSRFPRPIFSSIFLFLFFNQILKIKDQIRLDFQYKYLLILSFSLGMMINSFLYYFISSSILLIFLYLILKKKLNLIFELKNFKKIIFFFILLIFFSLPFTIQYYTKEEDHAIRMGLFVLNFEKKYLFFQNYMKLFLRLEVIIPILISSFLFLYSNYKIKFKKIFYINIFYIFLISNLLAPLIFVLLSNKGISIYHFILIVKFSCFFYLILVSLKIIEKYLKPKFYLKKNYKILFFTIILIIFTHLNIENYNQELKIKNEIINDYSKIELYLKNNNLFNTNLKLFSNDSGVNNLWLINGNKKLLLTDGWINSMKNKDIEYLYFNSLKAFGVEKNQLENFLSINKPLIRPDFFNFLFNYQYQANLLQSFSPIDDYDTYSQKLINKTSMFRSQLQIIPESEKLRIIKSFSKHSLNTKLEPDLVILYEKTFPFKILDKRYRKLIKYNNLAVYIKN
jgi:hypothetical protein